MSATERKEAIAFLEGIHRIVRYAQDRKQMSAAVRAEAKSLASLVGYKIGAMRQRG